MNQFYYKIVHCGILVQCIVGFVRWVKNILQVYSEAKVTQSVFGDISNINADISNYVEMSNYLDISQYLEISRDI